MKERNRFPISVQAVLEKENKILLMKRKNTGYEDGKYGLPGGHVKNNEEIREALKRELNEEVGIDVNIEELKLYKVLNRKIDDSKEYIDFVFKTDKWTGDIKNNEQDKCEEIIWENVENIPQNIIDFIPEMFKKTESIYMPYNWKK